MATWGQQTWGFENWGTLGDQTIDLSSISLSATLSQGTVTIDAVVEIGWGGDAWGENAWGELSGAYVDVSGISLTTNIGTISTSASALADPSGIAATFGVGQITQRIDAAFTVTGIEAQALVGNSEYASKITVSGVSAQTNTGQATVDPTFLIGEGWGRDTYGNLGWGVNYSVIGGGVNGLSLSAITGNEDAFTDVVVEVTGQELQTAITPVGTSANSDNEIAHSFLLNQNLGTVSLEGHANVQVTNQAPLFNFTAQGNAQLSTAQAKFGSSSLLLDGTDDYVDTTTNLDLSSGDFTVDVWIRPDNVTGYKVFGNQEQAHQNNLIY